MSNSVFLTVWLLLLLFFVACKCNANSINTLISQHEEETWVRIYHDEESGYINSEGDTVIPLGKYLFCYTDTFRTYAVVAIANIGFVAINKQEEILYPVYYFDNGPDIPSDGAFRILSNKSKKIGYADAVSGKVIIKPQYKAATPFVNGFAEVSNNCERKTDGELSKCEGGTRYIINKKNKMIKEIDGNDSTKVANLISKMASVIDNNLQVTASDLGILYLSYMPDYENNVELSQTKNEYLYYILQKDPSLLIRNMNMEKYLLLKNTIENPVNDIIDIGLCYKKVRAVQQNYRVRKKILNSLKTATKKNM